MKPYALKLAMVAPLALAGCQPPAPVILAVLEKGKITFHIREKGFIVDKVFGWDDSNWSSYGVQIEQNAELIWQTGVGGKWACSSADTFPVTYGESRCDPAVASTAPPLAKQTEYQIRYSGMPNETCERNETSCHVQGEWWSAGLLGRFRIRPDGSVDNISLY